MFLATSDAHGACDSTLRAGPPGFVVVLDEHRLAWPEYRGNGVMASRGNIIENPHVGLLFVDFVRDVIGLHVNGTARLVADAELRDLPGMPDDPVPGRRPEQWVVARVEEAYIHCAKYIPRLYAEPREEPHAIPRPQAKKSDYFAVKPDGGTGPTSGSSKIRRPVPQPSVPQPSVPQPSVPLAPAPLAPAASARRPSGTGWRRHLTAFLRRGHGPSR
jgi:predicted pyridoxine 5'-phosphate oxidase superfamily flavin-nucleotide-binding protein